MIYTIKIDDSTPKAENFVNFLKFLKKDFSFMEIEYDESLNQLKPILMLNYHEGLSYSMKIQVVKIGKF